jgi:hypothetical protein
MLPAYVRIYVYVFSIFKPKELMFYFSNNLMCRPKEARQFFTLDLFATDSYDNDHRELFAFVSPISYNSGKHTSG